MAFNKLQLSLNEDYCGAAKKALSWDFSATCFTKIMVVIWVVKPKGKCALL
jgi:hypothetical protein